MITNYNQICIIGTKFTLDEITIVDSPAVFEKQNRYDTRTGAITKIENVMISDEKFHYEFLGKSYDDIYDIENDYEDLVLHLDYDDNCAALGYEIEATDYGSAELIDVSLELEEITNIFAKMQIRFSNTKIEMHFLTRIG